MSIITWCACVTCGGNTYTHPLKHTFFHPYDLSLKISPDGKDSRLCHASLCPTSSEKSSSFSSQNERNKIKKQTPTVTQHHLIASQIPVDAAVHQYHRQFSQPNPHHLIDINSAAAHQATPLHSQSFLLAPVTLPLYQGKRCMLPGKVNVYLLSPLCYQYSVHCSHSSLLCLAHI